MKIYEIIVQKCIENIELIFNKSDKYNGGFKKGSRTSDNLLILQSLVERQLHLGQPLIVIFVDFSQAFDLLNRNILFYKLIKSGLHGRVINTLRSLYSKTYFRIKHEGKLSQRISQELGVNQGGNASPILFRKYMSDLGNYLSKHTGVHIGNDEILMHLLWADDLILLSTKINDASEQLRGVLHFCADNQQIVNEIKTKAMVFGMNSPLNLCFNSKAIEQVTEYKYVGNYINVINRPTNDIFRKNYSYLCDKARQAIFKLLRITNQKTFKGLPPSIMFHLFNATVMPILTYGSDIWGTNQNAIRAIDKVFLHFIRLVLGVKATTSNIITIGESGQIPPSIKCHIKTLLNFHRLNRFPPPVF